MYIEVCPFYTLYSQSRSEYLIVPRWWSIWHNLIPASKLVVRDKNTFNSFCLCPRNFISFFPRFSTRFLFLCERYSSLPHYITINDKNFSLCPSRFTSFFNSKIIVRSTPEKLRSKIHVLWSELRTLEYYTWRNGCFLLASMISEPNIIIFSRSTQLVSSSLVAVRAVIITIIVVIIVDRPYSMK